MGVGQAYVVVLITDGGMNFMNDSWFIDTNILLYAYDKEAGSKH
ncbi:MAG: hypothetical protein ACE5OR_10995 [bacterium]